MFECLAVLVLVASQVIDINDYQKARFVTVRAHCQMSLLS